MKNKIRFVLFILTILFPIIFIYLVTNWYYLPFVYEGYDRNFNNKRIELGQPIIEDYFIPEFKGAKRRQTWLTPDSLESTKLHHSKYYNTDKGNIVFEADFYGLKLDSVNYILRRNYHYNYDSVSFELMKEVDKKIEERDNLNKQEADSILAEWKTFYSTK